MSEQRFRNKGMMDILLYSINPLGVTLAFYELGRDAHPPGWPYDTDQPLEEWETEELKKIRFYRSLILFFETFFDTAIVYFALTAFDKLGEVQHIAVHGIVYLLSKMIVISGLEWVRRDAQYTDSS